MRLIVFDVDGTLVDSQHHIVAAQAVAFAAVGLAPPSRAAALSVVGLSLREAFRVLAGDDAPIDGLAEAYKDAWHQMRRQPAHEEPLFPGARESLARLAAVPGTLLGIATGKSRRGVAALLEAQGWAALFATIQTADDHPSKPDPSMLVAAMEETGAAPAMTAMIGDTSFDMAMAVAAGVRPLGVAWGYHPAAALLAAGATSVADSFEAVEAQLPRPADREAA
ncbi:HAD family hydrolase [Beijerinckiaceae bacterium RH AL1]|nr:HAD-IA family hydrolase [Beijerinckiaceae bacterium]VVB45686.1 HAD family hydrolase [Beijerinckiaceae bacterium RH CH11]VVB45761.1 HAD family hydrolase [Beijerinckiaceae bacterium RH AL8]VVC54989.1 HAD family hydrolase [Beijerinckiaceae bacterium RH AL1]